MLLEEGAAVDNTIGVQTRVVVGRRYTTRGATGDGGVSSTGADRYDSTDDESEERDEGGGGANLLRTGTSDRDRDYDGGDGRVTCLTRPNNE